MRQANGLSMHQNEQSKCIPTHIYILNHMFNVHLNTLCTLNLKLFLSFPNLISSNRHQASLNESKSGLNL